MMASKKFSNDEERKAKALEIASYIIDEHQKGNKVSTRILAEKFDLSNYTISILMGSYLKKRFLQIYNIVHPILVGNIPKTIENLEVNLRVLTAAKLVLQGNTVEQIVNYFKDDGITINVINEDLQTRLPKLAPELYNQVLAVHSNNSLNNLNKGNPNFENQARDESGRFTK